MTPLLLPLLAAALAAAPTTTAAQRKSAPTTTTTADSGKKLARDTSAATGTQGSGATQGAGGTPISGGNRPAGADATTQRLDSVLRAIDNQVSSLNTTLIVLVSIALGIAMVFLLWAMTRDIRVNGQPGIDSHWGGFGGGLGGWKVSPSLIYLTAAVAFGLMLTAVVFHAVDSFSAARVRIVQAAAEQPPAQKK